MIVATVLALTAAGLHAAWNLLAKRSDDRFLALWGQFAVAGVLSFVVVLAARDLPAAAWLPAALTGLIHIPYTICLAHAYDRGDFSVAYPVARGSGAVLSAIGGIVLLDDVLGVQAVVAIAIVAAGMGLLAVGAAPSQIATALIVGLCIGAYTVNDSHAVREYGVTYPFAVFALIGVTTTGLGLATGRGRAMVATMRDGWTRYSLTGSMVAASYALILVAVRRAPVGYVATLRESSVLIAAFLGQRYLDEHRVRQRTIAAAVILAGLVLLIAAL